MQRLAGVLFKMKTSDADALRPAVVFDFDPTAGGQGQFELRDLVALGEVGIEIIFAGKAGMLVNGAVECQGRAHAQFHGALIEDGQSARKAKANGTGIGVGRIAKAG